MDIIVWGSQLGRSSFLAQWFPNEQGWAGWGWGKGSTALSSTGEGFWMSSSHLCCTHWGAAAACTGKNLHTCMCSAFRIQPLHSNILPFRLNQRTIWQAPQRQHASPFIFALHAQFCWGPNYSSLFEQLWTRIRLPAVVWYCPYSTFPLQ